MSLTGITSTQTGLVSSVDLAGVQAALSIQIAAKADASSVYTQNQVNTLVSGLETQADLASKLSAKADLSTLNSTQAQLNAAQTTISSLQGQVAADVSQTQLQIAIAPLATSAALATVSAQVASHGTEINDLQRTAATAVQPADLASAVAPLRFERAHGEHSRTSGVAGLRWLSDRPSRQGQRRRGGLGSESGRIIRRQRLGSREQCFGGPHR